MLFNSFDFGIFLAIVFSIYWIIGKRNIRYQNILLLTSSYFFYGWWDWRFLILILASTAVDYAIGLKLEKTTNTAHRKLWLYCSLFFNLGLLAFFKYFNFSWIISTPEYNFLELIFPQIALILSFRLG